MDYLAIASSFLSFLLYLISLFLVFEIRLFINERLKLAANYIAIGLIGHILIRIIDFLIETTGQMSELERVKGVIIIGIPIFFVAGLWVFYMEFKCISTRERKTEPVEYRPQRKSTKEKEPKMMKTQLGKYLDLMGKKPKFRN